MNDFQFQSMMNQLSAQQNNNDDDEDEEHYGYHEYRHLPPMYERRY